MVGERNVDSRVPVPVPTGRTTGAQAGKEIKTFARPEDFFSRVSVEAGQKGCLDKEE
jgi:hypothetical protein